MLLSLQVPGFCGGGSAISAGRNLITQAKLLRLRLLTWHQQDISYIVTTLGVRSDICTALTHKYVADGRGVRTLLCLCLLLRTLLWHLGYKEGQAYMVDSYCMFRQRSNNNSILNGHIEPLTQGHIIFPSSLRTWLKPHLLYLHVLLSI